MKRELAGAYLQVSRQLAHLFDAVIAGAVDFEHVQGPALGDFDAARVFVVEIHLGAVGAVEAFGEDAGDGGFAGAAGAAEEVGMGDALLFDGVRQRLGDMLLAYDVAETLGTVFSGYDLVRHGLVER